MKRLAALLVAATGCALHPAHVDAQSCTSSRECSSGEVCFLGECRGAAASLAAVVAEVRPPSDSQLATLQRGGINPRQGVIQDFALEPPLSISGTVRQDLADGGVEAAPSAQVSFAAQSPPLPDRVSTAAAKSDVNGAFSTRLAPGFWTVAVAPAAPAPPSRSYTPLNNAQGGLELHLPRQDTLVHVLGMVDVSVDRATASPAPLEGARVVALSQGGDPLSALATVAGGQFELFLPPGTTSYLLQVGPGDPGTASADLPTWDGIVPTPLTAPFVHLATTALVSVTGNVSDTRGAPIAGAHISVVNDDPTWKMLRSAVTDVNGNYSLMLRGGNAWVFDAIPAADASAPGILELAGVTLAGASQVRNFVCPAKARATGIVVRPDGRPVGSGYAVNATRLPDRLVTARSAATATTDGYGRYHLTGDVGRYRLEVLPPQSTGLPRKIVQVELTGTGAELPLPEVALAQPVEVVGTVHGAAPGAADTAIVGATVDFFALDAAGKTSILLGTSVTDTQGRFKTVLPDVPAPASMSP